MSFKKFQQKNIYKYNNYNDIKKWDYKTLHSRIEDINPEVLGQIQLEWTKENNYKNSSKIIL